MRYNRNVATMLLLTVTIALLSTSLYITPTSISDADPSTYVIVPTLMLPLFILFSLKTRPEPRVGRKDVLIGIVSFAAFIAMTLLLRLYFTIFFVSFRVDMLLMPLALAAFVSLFFGAQNIRKFRGAMLYFLFASPLVLYPIMAQFNVFTQANSLLVYEMIKPFIHSAQYIAPITISANGYTIAIGQACVSIGIFIALALFLVPVAYLYDGKVKKKVLWVASSVVLLLVLNLARMLGISLVWLAYGPNATALLVHNFIGVLLFYIVIVVLILGSGFYGLSIARAKQRERKRAAKSDVPALSLLSALAFCTIYVYLTLNYSTSLAISPLQLANTGQFNFGNAQIASAIQGLVNRNNFTSFVITNKNGTNVLFSLVNKTISGTNPVLLYLSRPSSNTVAGLESNNRLLGTRLFFNRKGSREQVFDVVSNGTEFGVYNTNLPFELSNMSTATAGVYLIVPANELPHVYSCSNYDPLYSALLNLVVQASYNQTTGQNLLAVECMSGRIIWA